MANYSEYTEETSPAKSWEAVKAAVPGVRKVVLDSESETALVFTGRSLVARPADYETLSKLVATKKATPGKGSKAEDDQKKPDEGDQKA